MTSSAGKPKEEGVSKAQKTIRTMIKTLVFMEMICFIKYYVRSCFNLTKITVNVHYGRTQTILSDDTTFLKRKLT